MKPPKASHAEGRKKKFKNIDIRLWGNNETTCVYTIFNIYGTIFPFLGHFADVELLGAELYYVVDMSYCIFWKN